MSVGGRCIILNQRGKDGVYNRGVGKILRSGWRNKIGVFFYID